jgi:hypothetical protein
MYDKNKKPPSRIRDEGYSVVHPACPPSLLIKQQTALDALTGETRRWLICFDYFCTKESALS